MMTNRERVVLHALHAAGRPVEKLSLVKLHFMVRQQISVGEESPPCAFTQYQYRPFPVAYFNYLRHLGREIVISEILLTIRSVGRILGSGHGCGPGPGDLAASLFPPTKPRFGTSQ